MTFIGASFFGCGTLVSSGARKLGTGTKSTRGANCDQYTASILPNGSHERSSSKSCMGLTWLECKKSDDETNSLSDNYKAYDVMYDALKFEN